MAIIGGGERDLTIRLFANVDDFKRNMRSAEKDTSEFGGKVFDTLGKVGLALASAGAAVGSFAVKLGVDSVKAAIEANKQQERLAALLTNTGGATEKQIQLLNAQAQELAKVGVATKENVTITQSQLATFDLMGGTIAKLTPAIIDYVIAEKGATASTDDFKSMTNGLAQALNGNFASLTRTGFVLDEATKELIKTGTETERAAALVEVLNSTYKGFNETAGQTAEGSLIRLQNAFNDATAAIGEALLPILMELIDFIVEDVLPYFSKFVSFIVEKVIPAIDEYLRSAIERLTESFGGLGDAVDDTGERVREFGTGLQLVGQIAREIGAAVLQGPIIVLDLLGRTLEMLVRIIGAAVLAFRRDYVGALEILTGKSGYATQELAAMHQEFLNLQNSAKNAGNSIADAYRQFNYYNSVARTTTSQTTALTREIRELSNATYDNKLAIDENTKSKESNSRATKKVADDIDILYNSTKRATSANTAYKRSLDEVRRSFIELEVSQTFAGGAGSVVGSAGLSPLIPLGQRARAQNLTIAEYVAQNPVLLGSNPISQSVLIRNAADYFRNEFSRTELVDWDELIDKGLGELTFNRFEEILQDFEAAFRVIPGTRTGISGLTVDQLIALAKPVTINVNGAVADPEGTARAIQDVLQTSNARSGFQSLTPAFGLE